MRSIVLLLLLLLLVQSGKMCTGMKNDSFPFVSFRTYSTNPKHFVDNFADLALT
jgi:hypothetical protein